MSFTVSGLAAYVKQDPKKIAVDAMTKSVTAKLLLDNGAAQVGIKGSAKVILMSNTATFVDGANCSRTASDVTTFSDRTLTVKPLKSNADFCFKDLYNKVLVELISKGQSEESMDSSVYQMIADDRSKVISMEVEKLLWKGDTSLTGTNNLKWIDGILKLVSAGGTTVTLEETELIAELQEFVQGIDIAQLESEDFRVFMGADTMRALKLAVFNGKYFVPGAEDEIPGTGVKIQVVSGLNGSGKIIGSRISNFQLGVDMAGEEEKVTIKYDEINEKALMDYAFAIGIQIVFPAHAYYAVLA